MVGYVDNNGLIVRLVLLLYKKPIAYGLEIRCL